MSYTKNAVWNSILGWITVFLVADQAISARTVKTD
jgi:hypothetical protein